MIAIEICLIIIGVVFMLLSFRITEKLSPKDLELLGRLSREELKKIVEDELQKATVDVDNRLDEIIDLSMDKVEIAMEKESNEKIMAISEYSDTVLETINRNHNEVMFLYSMLNDKHSELIDFVNKPFTKEMQANAENNNAFLHPRALDMLSSKGGESEDGQDSKQKEPVRRPVEKQPELSPLAEMAEHVDSLDESFLDEPGTVAEPETEEKPAAPQNHNEQIMALYKQGKSAMEIAKALSIGVGEAQLVIGLFKGE